jgi:hypothetical protein
MRGAFFGSTRSDSLLLALEREALQYLRHDKEIHSLPWRAGIFGERSALDCAPTILLRLLHESFEFLRARDRPLGMPPSIFLPSEPVWARGKNDVLYSAFSERLHLRRNPKLQIDPHWEFPMSR